ncbi:MAG: ABC transporter ATP-binding protein [Clostridia bacterium]|nr:ABC transporter ATP-binding protein [Clostridia bacterium]
MKTFGRILSYMSGHRFRLVLVVIGIALSAGTNVLGTYMLKPIVNTLEDLVTAYGTGESTLAMFGDIVVYLVIMGAGYLLGVGGLYMYSRIMVTVSTDTLYRLRKDMFDHMQKLPIKYFDTRTHGEIMSRYTNDIDAMREMISQGIPQLINSSIRLVAVFVMMIIISPLLTLLTVAVLGLMVLAVRILTGKSKFYFSKRQKALGEVNGYVEEMTEGQKVVKVFGHEAEVKREFDEINEEVRVSTTAANTWASVLMPIMGNLSHLHYAITAVVGTIMVIRAVGSLDLGSLTSFLQYSRNFSMPITQLSQQFNSAMSALAGAERVFEIMDTPPEEDDGDVVLVYAQKGAGGELSESAVKTGTWAWRVPDGDGAALVECRGAVTLKDVTFSYDDEKTVLQNVSFYAKPGQKIALVGSTGAGKTTITNLINRFYDIQEGEIYYDGIPIKRIRKSELRRSMSMVLQDTHLFTGTVMDNIRYGRLDATDEEVIEAAKLANAHYFISHLPEGYSTVLTSDGMNLSQGQKQLLAIARAAVADTPVLVLDEATSSIDTRTELLIERGMDRLMQDRTVFVIAHRLSTVRNANAIMVLEHGEIIERGDHDSLLEDKGKYYQLYTGLFELS